MKLPSIAFKVGKSDFFKMLVKRDGNSMRLPIGSGAALVTLFTLQQGPPVTNQLFLLRRHRLVV